MHKHRAEERQLLQAALEAKLKVEAAQDYSPEAEYTKVEYLGEALKNVVEISSPPSATHSHVQNQQQHHYYRQQWG